MQFLRSVHALLSVCVVAALAVLGSLALGSAASEQLAAKRQISQQFRDDMQSCEPLAGEAAELCERQAHAWAEVARSELEARRQRLAQGRSDSKAQHKLAQARCNALSGRLRERCTGGAGRTAG